MQEQRAQIFYDQHKWKEARAEFEKLAASLKDPANPHRQHALLRAAQARVQLKGVAFAGVLSARSPIPTSMPSGSLYLAQIYRAAKKESEMLSGSEQVVQKYPSSKWSEEALMMVGNYYWVELDRAQSR